MPVRIYRWRAPELAVTLTSGGNLAADTTYYLAGFFNKAWTYNNANSIFSNVVAFTTDAANKSVSVYWKVTVPIQGFANAGGGKLRVNAINHCLAVGDTLIIESGAYTGSYTVVTWENYNSFLITAAYVSDYATTFRVETPHNTMDGLILYMHTVTPFSGDPTKGTWQGLYNKFSHRPWDKGYITNNIAVSALFSVTYFGQQAQIQGTAYPPAPWCKVMEKGKIWIACSGAATVAEIKQACIDADVLDVAYVMNLMFFSYGILQSSGTLDFTDMNIINYWGMIGGESSTAQISYTRCNAMFLEAHYGSYLRATANMSCFLFDSKAPAGARGLGNVYSYPIGSNNAFNSAKGISAEAQLGTVTGMVVNCDGSISSSWGIDCSKTARYKSCRINNGFVYVYYINQVPSSSLRILDGFYIDSSLAYDISVQSGNTYRLDLRNIDTKRTNNRKIVYTGYAFQSSVHNESLYFYRGGTIHVVDSNGLSVVGATVKLVGGTTDVSYTTDANGDATFEVLEQLDVPAATGNYYIETYYDNWTLTVIKAGYETYMSRTVLAKDIELSVTLRRSRITIDQEARL